MPNQYQTAITLNGGSFDLIAEVNPKKLKASYFEVLHHGIYLNDLLSATTLDYIQKYLDNEIQKYYNCQDDKFEGE